MVAVYPSAIKTFVYRQDFTELVEAADVNVSYDEIRAIQNTLGVNPQTDVIDGKVNTYTSVSNRISVVRQGLDKPFANVSAHNMLIPYNTQHTATWTSKSWDTHSIWQGGSQLICPRDGVYTFDIYIRWHGDNSPNDNQQPVFNRNGELYIAIGSVGDTGYIVNQGGFFPIGWQKSTHQSASITVPWVKGNAVQVYVYQGCLTTPITATAICSVTYHRDPPAFNFVHVGL